MASLYYNVAWWRHIATFCRRWLRYCLAALRHQSTTWTITDLSESSLISTRTTKTPAFWGYPPPPHDYPHYWVISDPKSKEDEVKVTNLKNLPKYLILKFLNRLYTPYLLKLLDKMCKYEIDPTSIVEDTEWTRFCPQTDSRTDGQTDKVKPVYPPFNFVEVGL